MKDNKYNGYENYETCVVKAHLDKDQLMSDTVNNLSGEIRDADALGKQIKEWIDSMDPFHGEDVSPSMKRIYGSSIWCDLLNSAMKQVNFTEIAQSLIDANPVDVYELRKEN